MFSAKVCHVAQERSDFNIGFHVNNDYLYLNWQVGFANLLVSQSLGDENKPGGVYFFPEQSVL